MAAMTLALMASASVATARWTPIIEQASRRFDVPAAWIERVMRAESGGRTTLHGAPIRSSAGAIGLMQLMPRTWLDMRAAHTLGDDPDEPRANIQAGTAYLRLLHDRFGYPGLFAAYNAGPARYADYLAGIRPLPGETRRYLARVAGRSGPLGSAASPTIDMAVFAIRRDIVVPRPSANQPSLFALGRSAR